MAPSGEMTPPAKPSAKISHRPAVPLRRESLEDDVVAALGVGSAIPGAVESDEEAIAIGGWKLLLVIEDHGVGSPVCGKGCDRAGLGGADAGLVAIAAVFRGEDEALEVGVVVALGPAVVAAVLKEHNFFRGKRGFLFGFVDLGPIGVELVASMLCDVDAVVCLIDAEAFSVADAGGVAIGGREGLICLLRVVAPDAATGLELFARIGAGRMQTAVLQLAGVGGRSNVNVEHAVVADIERVHGVVAAERKAGDDGDWRIAGDECVGGSV